MIERYRGPRRIRMHGDRFAKLRNDLNITLEEVSRRCNVTRQAVSLWEQERALPSDAAISLLSIWLGDKLDGVIDVKVWE